MAVLAVVGLLLSICYGYERHPEIGEKSWNGTKFKDATLICLATIGAIYIVSHLVHVPVRWISPSTDETPSYGGN